MYVIQEIEINFGKVGNFLASADIRVFGYTCLFAKLLLIGLPHFYAPGVSV